MTKLMKLRKDKRLRRDEVASEVGVSVRQFSDYELMKRDIPLSKAKRYAKVLGITINQFSQLYKEEK